VAIEPEPRWLLMRDVGGSPLGNEPPAQWAPGLAAFGGVQRAWADAVARLPAGQRVELEDRTPARLAEILPALVEDPGLGRLSALERARLIAELPRFVDACNRIAELGPPSTLVHGDFHPWNIHVAGERFTVIDWSDSCAGHPFLDLPTFIGRTRDVAARHAMLDAYLAGWAEGYERSRLEEAAQLGLVLGSFHQVESYRRIIASLDPEDLWDLAAGLPNYARRALAWLDGGLEAIPEDDHWSS
jgi:Ser/Thr protein kinase RdoA (MazF antagonist)